MKTLVLSGHPWRVLSPSVLELPRGDSSITIVYDGRSWRIGFDRCYALSEWNSRDEAAHAVAQAIDLATREMRA